MLMKAVLSEGERKDSRPLFWDDILEGEEENTQEGRRVRNLLPRPYLLQASSTVAVIIVEIFDVRMRLGTVILDWM